MYIFFLELALLANKTCKMFTLQKESQNVYYLFLKIVLTEALMKFRRHVEIQCTRFRLCRKRGGVYSVGAADRVRDRGCGVLAIGQLLVAGAGGHPGGRVTRGGGRVHARVAPAVRGAGAGPRQPVGRGLAVARAAAAGAAARARARSPPRRPAPLPRCLSRPPL